MTTNTRDELLDTATALVRRKGYSAFSYGDLAEAVGVRRASIHHHFPGKEDLGAAIVAQYTERFVAELDAISAKRLSPARAIAAYADLYRKGLAAKQACLCGILASEIAVLPEAVQVGVRRFFKLNIKWLEQVFSHGVECGALPVKFKAVREARMTLSALQGAMFVALSLGGTQSFDEAVESLLDRLK